MSDVIFALGIGTAVTFVQALLLLAIFLKAEFGLAPALTSLLPVAGMVVPYPLVIGGYVNASEATLLAAPLALAPFLILALKSWPIATRNATSPETLT